jgi:DNA-binding phage protein
MSRSRSYQKELIGYLQNPELAVAYLNAALEENDPELFKIALGNVAEAQGKVINFAEASRTIESNELNVELHQLITLIKDLGLILALRESSQVA